MDLSIVTVVKNAREDLMRTAASVQEQTIRPHLEYLVIDGASTDGTCALVQELADRGTVDRWISEPDEGIYEAMNKALELARGNWILFLNSGDVFHEPRSLENLFQFALKKEETPYGCSGVYGGCVQVLPDGRRIESPPLEPRKIYTRMVCSHQSLLLKTEAARAFPFDTRYRIAADHHQLLRMIYKFEPLWPTPQIVSEVRLESYTWDQLKKGLWEKRRALWETTHNPVFYIFHGIRYAGVGIKHLLKKTVRKPQ